METGRLEIRRFHSRYLVSRDHPAPDRIKARLDDAVAGGLADTLSSIFSRCFSDADSSIWLIRRLDIDLDVNAAWERDSLTRVLAQQVALTLHRVLQDGADGENVRWFPNHAAYLARFIADAAAGFAWHQWYYETFIGLRQLPISAALRTTICDEPAIGVAALHQLPPDELTRVLSTLTSQDAQHILDSIAATVPIAEELPCLEAARNAWEAAGWDLYEAHEESHTALRLYIAASRDRTDVGGAHLKAAALALARVPLLPKNHHALDQLDSPLVPRHTPFGGIFMLLPLLDELPLAEATRDWPGSEEADAVALVRFLLLVKCCGRSRVAKAIYDPLLRDLIGIAPSISPSVLAAWQKKISALNRKVFLKTLADWHDERGVSTVEVFGDRDKLRKDIAYLSLPKSVGLSRTLDFPLSIAAQTVMRVFSRRLPGFAGSNLPYLYSNFLACSATIEEEPERRVVRLSRPPLYLVLNLTGACNKTYRLSWLDDRPLALFPES